MAIQTIIYHYSVQDGLNHFLVTKTRNKLRFSKHKIIHAESLKFYDTHIQARIQKYFKGGFISTHVHIKTRQTCNYFSLLSFQEDCLLFLAFLIFEIWKGGDCNPCNPSSRSANDIYKHNWLPLLKRKDL